MPKAIETIQTRQRAEPLFATDKPLGAGGSVVLPNLPGEDGALVAGFAFVEIFAVSDQPFQILVFEGCRPGSPFIVPNEDGTFNSSLGPDGKHSVCARVFFCGVKLRAKLINLGGPQSFLSFCASGLPES